MKIKYILIFLFMLLIISCKENNISSFNEVYKIKNYDLLCSDRIDPWGPITDMEIIDSILVLKHANDNYHFSFINVKSGKLLRRWGCIGEGPNEFLDFGTGFTYVGSQIVFLERNKKHLNYVSIDEILRGDSIESFNIIKETYPYTIDFRPLGISIIGKNKIAIGAFKEGHFGVLDSLNNIVPYISRDPFDNSEIQGLNRGVVFQSEMRTNEKQKKFIISTFASDIFEIYSISEDSIYRTYMSPFQNIPQVWKKGEYYAINYDKSIAGLRNLAVSDELICFAYFPQTYNEAAILDFASNEILCFNWNGEKIRKYILPFPIAKFCIDQHYIYGITYQNEEVKILRFNL